MKTLIATVCSGLVFTLAGAAFAETVASVVALRGKATVERKGAALDAKTKLGIELQDTVATAEGARTKLLFIDDSVLTLAEKSRMNIDTFVHSRSDRGSSLFNLLDGKMRAVVGKTRFEVKTPTVVAAARGTVILFDVGTLNGKSFTRVTCIEGIVDVRAVTAPPGTKPVLLSPGQSLTVTAKLPTAEQKPAATEQKSAPADDKSSKSEKSSAPATTTDAPATKVEAPAQTVEAPVMKVEQLSSTEIAKLSAATSTSVADIKPPTQSMPTAPVAPVIPVTAIVPVIPQIQQQPARTQPTKVNIGVKF